MSRKFNVKAHHIKQSLAKKHANTDDFFLTEVKNGPTHFASELLIMDALAIKKRWANPLFQGYEIKVSRQDFLQDNKWHGYLSYCHRFSFVCPTGMIAPEELPEEIGLMYYNEDKGTLYTKRKAVHRNIELSADLMYYIIMSRLERDRHPFFSSSREMIEEYVADKIDKKALAIKFQSKITNDLDKAIQAKTEAERKAKRFEDDAANYQLMRKILEEHGISPWNWEDSLRQALSSSMPQHVVRLINRIHQDTEHLNKIISKGNKAV